MLLNDTQVGTRNPQQYVVQAVNYMCDMEIQVCEQAVEKLRSWRWVSMEDTIKEWEQTRSSLAPIDLKSYTPKEHSLLAPMAERPAVHKGSLLQFFKGRWITWQQEQFECEERDRQTMVREEAAQRQILRAWEAQERKADY